MTDLLFKVFNNAAKFTFPQKYVDSDDFKTFVIKTFSLTNEDDIEGLGFYLDPCKSTSQCIEETWNYLHEIDYFA